VVGRLTGSVDSRPFSLDAAGDRLTITDASPATLWRLCRCWPQVRTVLAPILAWLNLPLTTRCPVFGPQEMLPRPSWMARLTLGRRRAW